MPLRILPCRAVCAGLALAGLSLSGCSTSQLVARGASPLIAHGVAAMNRETDLELARASIPANLKMIEALLLADPGNVAYRVQAAMGFYGYALGFVEPDERDRAAELYQRARDHAQVALEHAGITPATLTGDAAGLEQALARLDARAVPALFWTASAWGKWIELQLDDPARLAELPRVESLMQRVLALDERIITAARTFLACITADARPCLAAILPVMQPSTSIVRSTQSEPVAIGWGVSCALPVAADGEREAFHATLGRDLTHQPAPTPNSILPTRWQKQAADLLARRRGIFDAQKPAQALIALTLLGSAAQRGRRLRAQIRHAAPAARPG
jgi:hypothetical protein